MEIGSPEFEEFISNWFKTVVFRTVLPSKWKDTMNDNPNPRTTFFAWDVANEERLHANNWKDRNKPPFYIRNANVI